MIFTEDPDISHLHTQYTNASLKGHLNILSLAQFLMLLWMTEWWAALNLSGKRSVMISEELLLSCRRGWELTGRQSEEQPEVQEIPVGNCLTVVMPVQVKELTGLLEARGDKVI